LGFGSFSVKGANPAKKGTSRTANLRIAGRFDQGRCIGWRSCDGKLKFGQNRWLSWLPLQLTVVRRRECSTSGSTRLIRANGIGVESLVSILCKKGILTNDEVTEFVEDIRKVRIKPCCSRRMLVSIRNALLPWCGELPYAPRWCIVVHEQGIVLMAQKKKRGSNPDKAAMPRASVTFPPDLYRTLENLAREKKVSIAWVVRDAAERYVEAAKGSGN
jgi:hypothetical protein